MATTGQTREVFARKNLEGRCLVMVVMKSGHAVEIESDEIVITRYVASNGNNSGISSIKGLNAKDAVPRSMFIEIDQIAMIYDLNDPPDREL
jgi:hypothetical protein